MKKSIRNIISVIIIVIIYVDTFYSNFTGFPEITINNLFGKYLWLSIFSLLLIYILNKYFLKNSLRVFLSKKGSFLLDISFSFLLLVTSYFVFNIGAATYGQLFVLEIDRSSMFKTLGEVFSKPIYIFLFFGPFIWFSEMFLAFSQAFILNNLWEINSNKFWVWATIIFTALLCSLTQIHNGIPSVINYFILYLVMNVLYHKYRRVTPLILSRVLLQTIQMAVVWTLYF